MALPPGTIVDQGKRGSTGISNSFVVGGKGKGKPAPTKTGMAGLFGGVGPNAYINNLYAPQQAQLAQQQAARTAGLQALVNSILAAQAQKGPDVYGAAAHDTTSAAQGASQSLAASNPNPQIQGMLQAINAPQAQQDAISNQNNVVFNGQGALQQYSSGALPAGVFAQDQAARDTYLKSLPTLIGQTAIHGLGRLDALASSENTNLATQRMQALQQAHSDLANYVQKNQALKAQAQKTAFDQNLATAKYRTGVDEFNTKTTMQARVDAFNQKYKIAGLQLRGQALQLQSNKFAQQTIQSDRTYGLQLKRIGLETRSLQIRALSAEYKYKNGGFTPHEVARYEGLLQTGIDTLPAGTSYQQFVAKSIEHGVPLSLAVQKANTHWPATQRPTPSDLSSILGIPQGEAAAATGWNQQVQDYNAMVGASSPQLSKVQPLIMQGAKRRGVDPYAVIAVSQMEGAGGGIGDNGTSFGPWQLHIGGALPKAVAARGAAYAHRWAWSPAGINYALDRIASVAKGLTGAAAVDAIVRRFERPANPDREVAGATSKYGG